MQGPPPPHYLPPAGDYQPPPYYPPPPVDHRADVYYHHHPPHHHFPPPSAHYNHPPFQNPNTQFPNPNSHFPPPDPQFHLPSRRFPPPDPQFHPPSRRFPPPDPQFQPPNPQVKPASHFPDPIAPPIEPRHTVASSSSAEGHHQDKKRKLSDESERQPPRPSREEVLQMIKAAVEQSRRELVASSESVSTWKVSQSALSKLEVDSWESMSFQLNEVPSLHRIILTEEKINTFIECFVAVRPVTSLYDLEVAICENEGIKRFEELDLGPLLRHPLIELYFSSKNMTEVYKITGKEIMEYLKEFIVKLKGKHIDGDELFDFVAKKCRLSSSEKMGLRIQNLGKHIKLIREGLRQETPLVKTCSPREDSLGEKSKKRPLYSVEEKQMDEPREDSLGEKNKKQLLLSVEENQMDEPVNAVTQPDPPTCFLKNSENNVPAKKKKKLKRQSCTSKDKQMDEPREDSLGEKSKKQLLLSVEENQMDEPVNGVTQADPPACILKNSENNEPAKKKKKLKKQSCTSKDKASTTGVYDTLGNDSIRLFITFWKEKCCQLTPTEVLEGMMQFYGLSTNQTDSFRKLVSMQPFLGLLNVAIISIKNGSWNSIYDMCQSLDKLGCQNTQSNNCIEYEGLDVESSGKDLLGSTTPLSKSGLSVTVEDIMNRVTDYFAKRLIHCEALLKKQYGVKEFGDLGYGDYLTFIERHISLLPEELHEKLDGQVQKEFSFETKTLISPTSVTVEDIMKKVREYFANKLPHCEAWLNKQYGVKEFIDFGFGDYLTFLERHISLLPEMLHENVNGQVHKQLSFETGPVLSSTSVTVEDIMNRVTNFFAKKLIHCEALLKKQYGVKEFGDLGYGDYLTFLERHISMLPEVLHDNQNGQVHEQSSFETEPVLSPTSVTIGDIMKKVKDFLARKLPHSESWLNKQYGVKDFGDLGFGEYLTFLETHISLLPEKLHKDLNDVVHKPFSFEVNLLEQQLIALLSQASGSLWEDGIITKQRIVGLLSRQFPSTNFNVVEKGCLDNISHAIEEQKSSIASKCLLFSATLSGMYDSGDAADHIANHSLHGSGFEADTGSKVKNVGAIASKDAVETVLKSPMLIDLNSWLHWDIVYAPSLGPLLTWLLTDVNAKDLLCLLTRDSKIIRINPSASVDSFYGALLQGSPFQVAVELLSLFSLFGGRRNLPLSLLKCRARQAFEVLFTIPNDGGQRYGNCLTNGKTSMKLMINENPGFVSGASISMKENDVKEPTFHASRLFLDCLGYLPSEFYGLAADILLSGLQSVVKYAPSSVLLQCRSKPEHLMLHEIGFALGITEWINDHQKICPIIADQCPMLIPASPRGSLGSNTKFEYQQLAKAKMLLPKEIISSKDDGEYEGDTNLNSSVSGLEIDISVRESIQDAPQAGGMKNAALVIESIRREEFGLDLDVESPMLKKQHARLGRALHCLSQELYSQDSHFLLELIQNADDNAYSNEVEPTLMFILQNSRIIVLNNEQGFTAENIRALCDVGNSTKSGSSSGYIGQKGIGFKSVFRVTDAPEIHSNGFHIKFDITEGQIGFVLPTVVPPCNGDLIRQLASAYPDQMDYNCWNTCIVLPLRSNLTQQLEVGKIISMFSDIHPSLLLFIHRLQCIKLINILDNSFIAMRKEIVGDGLVKVTYGENAMTWFIASKKLFPEIIRPGVKVTEISIAITLKECENGNYESHLEQQPVFAFLPLRTYGLKFILQGDFVLPSSREEVDGDSIWNQWLLSEFPNLFVSAEKQFCALPCFRENPGKAVTAYMHFVPLVGEVQGFFSCLPRMIISRLRQSDCLLQEGYNNTWVPPCRVLRNWNEQARMVLPDVLLQQHLGLSFLDKDIILSDQLARALSIQDYGPKLLVQCISSICSAENGLKSMGFRWLASWLNELHNMLHSQGMTPGHASLELDVINSLLKVPCVPLSDGTYGSVNEGTIWLNANFISTKSECNTDSLSFPKLYASMRIVNTKLFSAATEDASCLHDNIVNNVTSMLHKIGVQRLTPHDIIKGHILPVISDDKIASRDKSLFIECNAFAMLHFQSSCADCRVEKEKIISEFQSKALLLTNLGFKRLSETTIHFGKEFGSPIDANKLIRGLDYNWHEIDVLYLKYPLTEAISSGLSKWRDFFCSLGVTDFVKVTQVLRNMSDLSPIRFQQVKWDRDLISSSLPMRDWESQELDCMLLFLARNGGQESERSKYLLEVLDILWDDYFSGKTVFYFSCKSGENVTSFKSSLMNNLCDVRWVTSTMDDSLHYPRELFYHCEAVHSILGTSVPYAMPKIRNCKLLSEIGFKSLVTIDDILASLQKWRTLEPFKASVSQMSRLYTFISNEPAESKKKALEFLISEPFIFIPHACEVKRKGDVVGSFFSPEEVYWRDYSGALDSMKKLSSLIPNFPMSKMLCHIYPGLRDFFLDDCGVNETPPFLYYLHILEQLSVNPSPLHAASSVFQIFLRWSDGLRCGSMVDGDIFILRDKLLQLDFPVLPTVRDMWVSLHPSFGVICWSDDESLKNQFKHSDSIQFLYFGELTDAEKEMLQTKVSALLQKLGIPALSEIMTREAIHHGPSDSSYKASMVDWALPFAQRYIYTVQFEKYIQLKLSEFEKLRCLKIVVVEKLLFRNVVKKCGASSQQQFECSCLLQDTVLYTTQESDSHTLFMELSRLFFDGALELQLANFLHMLTTMAESGSTQEQLEFFILNSQKIQRIPDEESVWCLYSHQASEENDLALQVDSTSTTFNEQNSMKLKNKEGFVCWPPVSWKTALGFNYGLLPTSDTMTEQGESSEDFVTEEDVVLETAPFPSDLGIPDIFGIPEYQPDPVSEQAHGKTALLCPTSVAFEFHSAGSRKASKTKNDPKTYEARETDLVGRLGEFTAFQHLKKKFPEYLVNWVNEQNESGLPYDIVIGNGNSREYVEVKSTRYESKNWFRISLREWQFAAERGNCFSLARVVLRNKDTARITVYRNPVKLCQLRQLDLGIMVPRQQQSEPSALPQ